MSASSPHLTTLLLTIGIGLVMCRMGFREWRLHPRRSRVKCASCGRRLDTSQRCSSCG